MGDDSRTGTFVGSRSGAGDRRSMLGRQLRNRRGIIGDWCVAATLRLTPSCVCLANTRGEGTSSTSSRFTPSASSLSLSHTSWMS